MDVYSFLKEPLVKKHKISRQKHNDSTNGTNGYQIYDDMKIINYASGASSIKPNFEEDCDPDLDLYLLNNPYIARALEVINIQFLDLNENDLEHVTKPFRPTMAHQVFGHEELIHGYRNLQIYFSLLPNSFHTKIKFTYDEKCDPVRGDFCDDIMLKLSEWFPNSVTSDSAFDDLKKKEDMSKMFGENLITFTSYDSDKPREIYINICKLDEEFIEFHTRFQGLIVFYIDAASMLDFSDKNWSYFYVYTEVQLNNNKKGYIPIGFCTVYNFTMSARARIAQQFILPAYQGKGIGTRLLGTVYKYFYLKDDIKYVTVESPCEEFTIMRDKLDLQLIINQIAFKKSRILKGYSQKMEYVAQKTCKMCVSQVKHLYYILYCYYTKDDSKLYDKFISYMKKEIHAGYKRKLSRVNSNPDKVERVIRIKRIVQDDYLINRRIYKDFKMFIKSIQPQIQSIECCLNK